MLQACRLEDYEFTVEEREQKLIRTLAQIGYLHQGFYWEMSSTIQPRFSSVVFDEGDFMGSLPNRTKRFLKDAVKRNVVVERHGKEAMDDFMFVIGKTEDRKEISLRSREYFERFFDVYGEDCILYIGKIYLKQAYEEYSARLEEFEKELEKLPESAYKKINRLNDQIGSTKKYIEFFKERMEVDGDVAILAGCLSVLYGHGLEMLYAGMNEDYSKIPAQFPVYVESMQLAFSKGADYASMGGVEGDLQDGLLRFKENFSPKLVEEIGEFDRVFSRFWYFAYKKGLPKLRAVRAKLRRR